MRKSLIICKVGYYSSNKVAKIFSLILGASKIIDMEYISENIGNYDNIVLIVGPHRTNDIKNLKSYLKSNKEKVSTMRIGVIGLGIPEKCLYNYVDNLFNDTEEKPDVEELIQGKFNIEEVTIIASKCSEILNKPVLELDKEELVEEIGKYILRHNTCVLATGSGKFVRSTPIEFMYLNGDFYFITEGGYKFRGILENPNVSISIFEEYKDMQHLKGLQVSGKAMIIKNYSEEYNEVMKVKGVKVSVLKDMPINLNLIKVKVDRYEFLNSDFAKKNVDIKQILLNHNK